jgi:DNA-binding beta-propeller fold protein YncE
MHSRPCRIALAASSGCHAAPHTLASPAHRALCAHGLSILAVVAFGILFLGPLAATGAAQNSGYAITNRYQLGGEGGWDYLAFDTAGHRLFITRGTHVEVVNPDNGTVIGDIPNTPHVHGIALADDLGRGFITAAGDTSIHIFDLKTLRPIGAVKAEPDDDALLYDPATHYVVSMNGDSHSATVIDGAAGTAVGRVELPGGPEFEVTDNHGTVYANIEDKSLLVAIDLKSLKVTKQWSLAPCHSPSGLAIDPAHHRLFSGCHNQVMAISDAIAGRVITTVPIGGRVDANRYDSGTQLAFSSNGDGTLTVVHEDSPAHFTELGTLKTQLGARTMALDPDSHTIYLVTANFQPAQGNDRPQPVPGSFVLLVATRSH